MYPAQFDYQKATSVDDALRALAENPDLKVIAGGHSLLPSRPPCWTCGAWRNCAASDARATCGRSAP